MHFVCDLLAVLVSTINNVVSFAIFAVKDFMITIKMNEKLSLHSDYLTYLVNKFEIDAKESE